MNAIIKKNGLNFGIATGIISILTTTLIYVIDLKLFVSWWIGLLSFLIYIILGIALMIKTKKELNGLFIFKDAFTTYVVCAVIGISISVVFNIILFNYVDPLAKETIKELTMQMMVTMMNKFGTPAATINEALKGIKENDQFSVANLLKGGLTSIVISSVFGVLLAAIFKTKTISNN